MENTYPWSKLQLISKDLLESTTAAEISTELELMLSVYIQHAPVDRLSLANVAGLTSRLITYVNKLEIEVERNELVNVEEFTV
jgi:superfamily II RNA helicase